MQQRGKHARRRLSTSTLRESLARWDLQEVEGQDRRSKSLEPRAWRLRLQAAFLVGRTAQRLGVAMAGVTLLSGCLGDPPPDPEVQPLEVIAGNPDPAYGPCLLNVDEVGAGTHEVAPLSLQGKATVRILDPSGSVIFERAIEEAASEGGGHEVLGEDQGSVRLEAGDHRVECVVSDGTHTTELLVVPP